MILDSQTVLVAITDVLHAQGHLTIVLLVILPKTGRITHLNVLVLRVILKIPLSQIVLSVMPNVRNAQHLPIHVLNVQEKIEQLLQLVIASRDSSTMELLAA